MRSVALAVVLVAFVYGCDALIGANFDVEPRTDGDGGTAGTAQTSTGGNGGEPTNGGNGGDGGDGGDGGCVVENCPGTSTDCLQVICRNDQCDVDIIPTGSVCNDDGGSFCDGIGNCVECTSTSHCAAVDPTALCLDFTCYFASCNNGSFDAASETDVDCGDTCPSCDNGRNCVDNSDCTSNLCNGTNCDSCSMEGDCATNYWCDLFDGGACKLKEANGSFCTSDVQCLSDCCQTVCTTC